MKATKKQALECYDQFFSALRCHNGGTREENIRNAPTCLAGLEAAAARAAELAANPSKLLRADPFLWERLTVLIPERLASFRAKYSPATAEGGNVIQFPAQ